MNARKLIRMRGRQDGMAVLENLIAILIFSFGILGIIGLLATSMKSSASAKYRNDASMLANQIVGQMWIADKSNAALKAGFESPGGASFSTWKTSVGNTLPGITETANLPTIAIDANNVATVTVRWQAPGETAAHNYVLIARING